MTDGHKRQPPEATPPKVVPLHDHVLQQVVNAILSSSEGDTRPVLLFLAGCNGSGKTSFFGLLDEQPGRRFTFVNADLIGSIVSGIPGKDRLAQNNFVETGIVLDNSSAISPLRLMAIVQKGKTTYQQPKLPAYVKDLLPIPASANEPTPTQR